MGDGFVSSAVVLTSLLVMKITVCISNRFLHTRSIRTVEKRGSTFRRANKTHGGFPFWSRVLLVTRAFARADTLVKYAYHDLSAKQFETLIVLLCQKLLGMGVQPFSDGADGGRDARFIGTAEAHPSTVDPWSGAIIIQAKHTTGYNKSFSESEFYSDASVNTIIAKEVPRIKALRESGELDFYMLFANRRLSTTADGDIRKHIAEQCALPPRSITLVGIESLETYFKAHSDIPEKADLDPIDSPLVMSPDIMAEIIEALARHRETVVAAAERVPMKRTSFKEKNRLNNMTDEYSSAVRRTYLKETVAIQRFLASPENADILKQYDELVEELQFKIIAKRKDYQTFDEVMEHLSDVLLSRDVVLRGNRRQTRALLFHMYWSCDIGKSEDVAAE